MTSNRKIAIVVATWLASGCQVADAQCADNADYVDDSGTKCAGWAGWYCTGWPNVIKNCPQTCGYCGGAAPSPAAVHEEPVASPAASPNSAEPPAEYKQPVELLGTSDMTNVQANLMLTLTNKMRCSVGVGAVKWNADLAKQAEAQKYLGFSHSDCYGLDIAAGENIATGTDVATAVYMWFSEYTEASCGSMGACGHYSALTWLGVDEIGCSLDDSGDGVIRCQYIGKPLPNYGGDDVYTANVLPFDPTTNAAKMATCGFDNNELQAMMDKFRQWGLIQRYQVFKNLAPQSAVPLGLIAAGVLMAVAGVGVAYKRFARKPQTARDCEVEPLTNEEEELE